MQTKDIFIWLGIFIIGSLIVTFLVNPTSFQSFKSNIKGVSINKAVSGIGTISIQELVENLDEFVGKEITIVGKEGIVMASATRETCYKKIKYDAYLYQENKITIPSSRYEIPIKIEGLLWGDEWKCKGTLKKETLNRYECEYSKKIGDTKGYEKDNCELEPTTDCYYFEPSFCECLSDYC